MSLAVINCLVTVAFGLCVGFYQMSRGVRFPVWYVVIYTVLFVAGLNLLEAALGIR